MEHIPGVYVEAGMASGNGEMLTLRKDGTCEFYECTDEKVFESKGSGKWRFEEQGEEAAVVLELESLWIRHFSKGLDAEPSVSEIVGPICKTYMIDTLLDEEYFIKKE